VPGRPFANRFSEPALGSGLGFEIPSLRSDRTISAGIIKGSGEPTDFIDGQ